MVDTIIEIPQVNAGVTPGNREQTRRICALLGYTYDDKHFRHIVGILKTKHAGGDKTEILPKLIAYAYEGSLALGQVVGMLETEGWVYRPNEDYWPSGDYYGDDLQGYFKMTAPPAAAFGEKEPGIYHRDEDAILARDAHPHDLTAAMDALIKVLEEKKCQT